ncbi:MAG: hypothetical protein J3R72DRAFT_495633 [Linnemannia gamsii]|nr:MAG: hypothetical protein J3R72DRAFT_495633 [Linnemannia gamsii]
MSTDISISKPSDAEDGGDYDSEGAMADLLIKTGPQGHDNENDEDQDTEKNKDSLTHLYTLNNLQILNISRIQDHNIQEPELDLMKTH